MNIRNLKRNLTAKTNKKLEIDQTGEIFSVIKENTNKIVQKNPSSNEVNIVLELGDLKISPRNKSCDMGYNMDLNETMKSNELDSELMSKIIINIFR